jgi:hypothetical protein
MFFGSQIEEVCREIEGFKERHSAIVLDVHKRRIDLLFDYFRVYMHTHECTNNSWRRRTISKFCRGLGISFTTKKCKMCVLANNVLEVKTIMEFYREMAFMFCVKKRRAQQGV